MLVNSFITWSSSAAITGLVEGSMRQDLCLLSALPDRRQRGSTQYSTYKRIAAWPVPGVLRVRGRQLRTLAQEHYENE
jgi:hypothetical protein